MTSPLRAVRVPAAALIAGLSLVGCSSGEGGAAEPTSAGTDPAASQVASTAPTTPPSAMTIEQIAAACLDGPAPVEVLTAGQDSEPVVATAPEGGNLCVGPVALTGDAVEKAEVVLGADQQWAVALTFTEEGIDRFNQVAELCFTSAEGICPTGRLAVLVDGRVVTAPSVQSPSFLRDQIQISGSFTEDEAGGLATAIDDGGITFRPVLVQLPEGARAPGRGRGGEATGERAPSLNSAVGPQTTPHQRAVNFARSGEVAHRVTGPGQSEAGAQIDAASRWRWS